MPIGAFRLNTLSNPGGTSGISGFFLTSVSSVTENSSSTIQVDGTGNIFLSYTSAATSFNTAYSMRFSSTGTISWQRAIGFASTATYNHYSSVLLGNGNLVTVGFRSVSGQNGGFWQISNGSTGANIASSYTPFNTGNINKIAVACDSSDNIYALTLNQSGTGSFCIWKYDSAGNFISQSPRIKGGGSPYGFGNFHGGSNGNTVRFVTDNYTHTGSTTSRFTVFNETGDPICVYASGQSGGSASGICVDSSGNSYVGLDDGYLVALDSAGQILWQKNMTYYITGLTTDDTNLYVTFNYNAEIYVCSISAATGNINWQNKISLPSTQLFPSGVNPGVVIRSSLIYLSFLNNTSKDTVVAAVPSDGTGQGRYGSYVYTKTNIIPSANLALTRTTASTQSSGAGTWNRFTETPTSTTTTNTSSGQSFITASSPLSYTFFNSATSGTNTITMPASVASGDIAIMFDTQMNSTTTIPTSVIPSGWTNILDDGRTAAGTNGGRFMIHYRILNGTEGGTSITGMAAGNLTPEKMIVVYRPSSSSYAVTITPLGNVFPNNNSLQFTTAAPTNTTLPMTGLTGPFIGFAYWFANGAVTSRGSTVTATREISRATTAYLQTFESTSSSVNINNSTISMSDFGTNALIQFVMTLTA